MEKTKRLNNTKINAHEIGGSSNRQSDPIHHAKQPVLSKIVDLVNGLRTVHSGYITGGHVTPIGQMGNLDTAIGQDQRTTVQQPAEIKLIT